MKKVLLTKQLRPSPFHMTVMGCILTIPSLIQSEILAPVNLRSTAHYAVLAGSLVSNIPASAITGDMGLSPAAGSMITGFGSTEVTGTLFTVDANGPAGSVMAPSDLLTAKGDLTLAYNDAAGRTPVPTGTFLDPGAGNIGGMTLIPGLYKFTSSASVTGSDLTLSGNATDVWIFQIASDLNVGNGIKVTLAGGALAANIFWQIGTSATLGTTSAFTGTIMANQSITLNTGATLNGRALASIAAITLDQSTITRPELGTTLLKNDANRNPRTQLGNTPRFSRMAGMNFILPVQSGKSVEFTNTLGQQARIHKKAIP